MRIMTTGLVALALLTAAACGDDDGGDDAGSEGGGERQEYVDAVTATIGDEEELNAEQRECMGGAFVDAIGVDRLSEAATPDEVRALEQDFEPQAIGIEPDEQMATDFYDSLSGCVDVRAIMLESLTSEENMSEEAAQCVNEAISDDMLRDLMVASLLGGEEGIAADPEMEAQFTEAITPCAAVDGGTATTGG
jgi:hypothetical protein